jgi:hypothetical protein
VEDPATAQANEDDITSLRAGDVEASATLGTFAPHLTGRTSGPIFTLSGILSRRVALRREQRMQLKSNYRENRPTGKEGDTNHRLHKHSPQKRRNDGSPVGHLGRIILKRDKCGMQTRDRQRPRRKQLYNNCC